MYHFPISVHHFEVETSFFPQDGEHLFLPNDKSLQPLRNIRNSLMQELSKLQTPQQHGQTQQGARPQNLVAGSGVSQPQVIDSAFKI